MSLTVGTDTYISLTDANTYVAANYATTQTQYTSWAALTDGNKEAYLRQALQKIERQILMGRKVLDSQTLQFPRAWKVPYFYRGWSYGNGVGSYNREWYEQSEVPTEVKNAQVEEALALIAGPSDRVLLQREGVKSFSLGSLSESYDGSKKSTQELLSDEAKYLLKPYVLTSVEIA